MQLFLRTCFHLSSFLFRLILFLRFLLFSPQKKTPSDFYLKLKSKDF